ncbi:MAG: hypothetical protein ACO3AY_05195 [Chitinophagaceae bacterium]|jgi:hypothetical protein
MTKSNKIIVKRTIVRPIALMLFLLITVGAFATLGDGKKKSAVISKKILSGRSVQFDGNFTLRSGYNFRGNTVLAPEQKMVVRINTNVVVGKGNNSFTVPLRGKAVISKLKIELGNRSFNNR